MNIRRAIQQEDISNDTLAKIISTEPVLSAQILKMSNSAAYNTTGKNNSELRVATLRLGYVKVKNLTIAVGMKQLTEYKDLNKDISRLMEGLWNRSLRVASFALVLSKTMTRVNPDNAMLAGLLHDVGKFYILNRASHFQSLFTPQAALWNVVDDWHSNIGAAILENWDISDEIKDAVQNFGNPAYVHQGAIDLTEVIFAADLLDAHFDERSPRKLNWDALPPVLTRLGLDAEKSSHLHTLMKTEMDIFLNVIR